MPLPTAEQIHVNRPLWYEPRRRRRREKDGAGLTPERLREAHDLLAAEMRRRGMVHRTPLEKADVNPGFESGPGLYLVAPHARMLVEGEKKAMLKSRAYAGLNEWHIILGDGKAWGWARFGEGEELEREDALKRRAQHRVSPEEADRWWPKAGSLWYYPVEEARAFEKPVKVNIPRGVQTTVREVNLPPGAKLAKAAVPDEVMVVPDFVSVVGSAVEDPVGAADMDVLFRADRRAGKFLVDAEGAELAVRKALAPEKERVLHYIASAQGPHADYVPVYDLVLRRCRRGRQRVGKAEAVRLDLGCGGNKAGPDWTGVDKEPGEGVNVVADLDQEWPFPDDHADEVRAHHVFEHLANTEHAMAELHRVLKPGGRAEVTVPSTRGEGAFAHPGHKSFWNKASFAFWTEDGLREDRPPFELVSLEEVERGDAVDVVAVLRKSEAAEKAVAPGRRFAPPKPGMAAMTEAFSAKELWDDWASGRVKDGLVAEPKYNGFRAIASKKGGAVSLWFEDSGQERGLPGVNEALARIPDDFVLDCNVGIDRDGEPLPRIELMTLTAEEPQLREGDIVKATVFDLPYWREDLSGRPFGERRTALERFFARRLRGDKHFALSPQTRIESQADLDGALKSPQFGRAAGSEGLVVKVLRSGEYGSGGVDWMGKVKRVVELKVLVLGKIKTKGGAWVYRCGLADPGEWGNTAEFRGGEYVDLGETFSTSVAADPGDVLTVHVQEVLPRESGELEWLGAKVVDRDASRKEPYSAGQVVEMAGRAGVLQKAAGSGFQTEIGKEAAEDEGGTRGEAAEREWQRNWWRAPPKSGRGRFVYMHHWMGLTEEQSRMDEPELFRSAKSVHGDLRFTADPAFGDLWGFSMFTAGAEKTGLGDEERLISLPEDDKLQGAFKLPQPEEWLTICRRKPYVSGPGGPGATAGKYAKFFEQDSGEYEVGVWREHFIEVFLHGDRLKGRMLFQFAPVGLAKFNPYHDKAGRFASGPGAGGKASIDALNEVWGRSKGAPGQEAVAYIDGQTGKLVPGSVATAGFGPSGRISVGTRGGRFGGMAIHQRESPECRPTLASAHSPS